MRGNGEENGAGGDAPQDEEHHEDKGRLRGLHKRIGSRFRGILDKRGRKDAAGPGKDAESIKGKEAGDMVDKKTGEGDSKDDAGKPEEKPAEPQAEEAGKKKEEQASEEAKEDKAEKGSGKADETKDAKDAKDDEPAGKKKKDGKPVAKKGKPGKSAKEAAGEAEENEEKPEESMSELITQKDEVEALLSSIEDAYREATLPDNTYHEVKTKNEKKLEAIEGKIEALEATGVKAEDVVKEEAVPAASLRPPEAGKPVMVAAPAGPARAPVSAAPVPRAGGLSSMPVLEDFEKMIGDRMKDVITAASLEMTDKRIKKVDDRLDALELDVKAFKKTAETVAGYDKQFMLINTNVEKTKALIEGNKESKNMTDEKIQRMTESFAEIRSIVYQREAQSKEQEVVFDKLKDTISQVDSARILREFTTRDEQLRDVNTRLERLERSGKMLSETMGKIKGLMTDIGSLENIVKASKHVGEKLEKIQEIEGRMRATSSRLDGVYVDMKKRMDEFSIYKVKQDKQEGISGDLMKNLEDLTRRLTDFAMKDDIELVKQLVSDVKEKVKQATAESAAVELPPEAKLLKEEKEEIETLLSTLEENLHNKEISPEEYDNAKSSNLQKIKEIDAKLQSFSKPAAKSGKSAKGADEGDEKGSKAMLMAKLKESYESGELSRKAYLKSRRTLIKK